MRKSFFASGLVAILSSLALAQGSTTSTTAMLSQLDQDLNSCMIPAKQSIQSFLTSSYAQEVRAEKNLDISGHFHSWSLGIMAGVLGNPSSIMTNLVGLGGGVSAGGGSGEIQGTGTDIHADHANLFVLTIFDNDAWASFDQQWRALSAKNPNLRVDDGLKSILNWSSKASKQLANNYHAAELKKNLLRFNQCRDDATALLGKLAFASRDAQKMSVISEQFDRVTSWADSISINVFVLSTSKVMAPYVADNDGDDISGNQDATPWAIGFRLGDINDPTFNQLFNDEVSAANQGNLTLDDSQGDIASYFIYSKTPTEPKRLSSNWKDF